MDGVRIKFWELPLWGSVALLLLILAVGRGSAATLDQQVSLDLTTGTLGQALESLARQTGCQFDVDSQWTQQPVTLKVQNISLKECLQRLLENLNYAIVLQPAQKIALNIFGEKSAARNSPRMPVPEPRRNYVPPPDVGAGRVVLPEEEPDQEPQGGPDEEPDEELPEEEGEEEADEEVEEEGEGDGPGPEDGPPGEDEDGAPDGGDSEEPAAEAGEAADEAVSPDSSGAVQVPRVRSVG